jgi:hypothetical protein
LLRLSQESLTSLSVGQFSGGCPRFSGGSLQSFAERHGVLSSIPLGRHEASWFTCALPPQRLRRRRLAVANPGYSGAQEKTAKVAEQFWHFAVLTSPFARRIKAACPRIWEVSELSE